MHACMHVWREEKRCVCVCVCDVPEVELKEGRRDGKAADPCKVRAAGVSGRRGGFGGGSTGPLAPETDFPTTGVRADV